MAGQTLADKRARTQKTQRGIMMVLRKQGGGVRAQWGSAERHDGVTVRGVVVSVAMVVLVAVAMGALVVDVVVEVVW